MAVAIVIDEKTGAILNMIVADPKVDPAPNGHKLIAAQGLPIDTKWQWNGVSFIAPIAGPTVL